MSIESVILTNLIHNEQYARAVIPYLQTDYFETEANKTVFDQIRNFLTKYNVPPTKEALAISAMNDNLHEGHFEEVIEVIKGLDKSEDVTIQWLMDETETYCKNRALFLALYQAIDISEGNVKDKTPAVIPGMLMDALSIAFESNLGHDYWEDAEEHWQNLHSAEARIPFSLPILNKVSKGGIKKKTLNVVLAPINGGKSIHLVQQAAEHLVEGRNVLYISMEMDEATVRERVDCATLDMTFDQVFALEKAQYVNRINDIKKKTQGRLRVKEFPAGSAHVGHFRHLVQELKIKEKFIPDVICIDYLTICASSKLPASAKGNTNTYFTSVAEEMRALAQELGVPIWTAIQLDRATQGASDAGLGNVALALGIAATADFMFAILIPEELAARGQVIGKIIKNRYSSYKGKFILGLNPEKQKFYEVDQVAAMSSEELEELGIENSIPAGTKIISREVTKAATEGWNFG